jgi:hypothetical protein
LGPDFPRWGTRDFPAIGVRKRRVFRAHADGKNGKN